MDNCAGYNERPKYYLIVFCSLEYSNRQNGKILKSVAIGYKKDTVKQIKTEK